MTRRFLISHALAWLAGISIITAAPSAAEAKLPETCYLFSYFIGNGEDGLHLAWSTDGLEWKALKEGKSFLTPKVGKSKLMRDPCVAQGPDGLFHMVWTDSWNSRTIGYASSKNIIHWSEQKEIPVMADEPTARNCWAPEIIYDAKRERFMIFWASTIPGKFPESDRGAENDNNHRTYATTTTDFETFSPTRLFFDPGFNSIDSTLMMFQSRAVMFFKDETKAPKPMKNIRIATAPELSGPWQVEEKPVNPPGSWVEGPSAIKIGDQVFLYFDVYTKHHYAALTSRDLKNWEDATKQLSMPKGIRHGTAFAVPADVLRGLLKQ
jgi:hypothetical protein